MRLGSSKISQVRRGFTLIELMVVTAIIVLIIGVSLPAIKAMTKGNDTAQATSMVSSLIANARSIAISQGRVAGVAFFEANSGKAGQTQAAFVVEDLVTSVNTNNILFLTPLAGGTVQALPRGAKIAGLVAANNTAASVGTVNIINPSGSATARVAARVVLFDEGGQLLVRANNLLDTTSTVPSTQAMLTQWGGGTSGDWQWTTAGGNVANPSTPALVIYSDAEFQSAGISPNAAAQNQWLLQHAKVLVVNAYTGTVIQ